MNSATVFPVPPRSVPTGLAVSNNAHAERIRRVGRSLFDEGLAGLPQVNSSKELVTLLRGLASRAEAISSAERSMEA
jgi:hypothetical protein